MGRRVSVESAAPETDRRWGIMDAVKRFSVVRRPSPGPAPEVEVVEKEDVVVVTAAVSGFEAQDLTVDVGPHRLVIAAKGGRPYDMDAGIPPWDVLVTGFERHVALAVEVKPETSRAHYHNGTLEVVMPKRARGGASVARLGGE